MSKPGIQCGSEDDLCSKDEGSNSDVTHKLKKARGCYQRFQERQERLQQGDIRDKVTCEDTATSFHQCDTAFDTGTKMKYFCIGNPSHRIYDT